jgi:hypothetical protein
VVAAFLGGMALQKRLDAPTWIYRAPKGVALPQDGYYVELIRLPDGSTWQRAVEADE